MWTASKLAKLTSEQVTFWTSHTQSPSVPLAQGLRWAEATEQLGANTLWVGNVQDRVGGMVYELPGEEGIYHCQNGPLMDWDQPERAIQQLAYFARTLAFYSGGSFRELRMRPRFELSGWENHSARYPLQPTAIEFASTLKVPLQGAIEELMSSFSPRMQRTLRKSFAVGLETSWSEVDSSTGPSLAESARWYGKRKGFFVPPWAWFSSLSGSSRYGSRSSQFFLAQVSSGLSTARAWIWIQGEEAHYLYGDYSGPRLGAGVALGAAVQVVAMLGAFSEGARLYDFNGYTRDPSTSPSYQGVSEFKKQFGGKIVDYAVPEWVIQG